MLSLWYLLTCHLGHKYKPVWRQDEHAVEDLLPIQMQHMLLSWEKICANCFLSKVSLRSNTWGWKNKPLTHLTVIAVEEGSKRNCVPSHGELPRTEQNHRAGLGLPSENSELRMGVTHTLSLIQIRDVFYMYCMYLNVFPLKPLGFYGRFNLWNVEMLVGLTV